MVLPVPRQRDWLRLGQTVRERREHLRLPQGAGGISAATWRKVEKAVDPPYAPRTVRAICEALQWTPDSFDSVLAGHEPTELDSWPAPVGPSALEQAYEELAAEVRALRDEVAELKKRQRS